MTVTLDIPDALAGSLDHARSSLSKVMLDGFAAEAYRQGLLSAAEIRILMGHESRWEAEDFLAAHDAWPGASADEVTEDGRKLKKLLR